MANTDSNFFEIQRRTIMFLPTTSMPDGSTLSYDGNPNDVVSGNTPGETLLFNCPSGNLYQESNGTCWRKKNTPNSWIVLGEGQIGGYIEGYLTKGDSSGNLVSSKYIVGGVNNTNSTLSNKVLATDSDGVTSSSITSYTENSACSSYLGAAIFEEAMPGMYLPSVVIDNKVIGKTKTDESVIFGFDGAQQAGGARMVMYLDTANTGDSGAVFLFGTTTEHRVIFGSNDTPLITLGATGTDIYLHQLLEDNTGNILFVKNDKVSYGRLTNTMITGLTENEIVIGASDGTLTQISNIKIGDTSNSVVPTPSISKGIIFGDDTLNDLSFWAAQDTANNTQYIGLGVHDGGNFAPYYIKYLVASTVEHHFNGKVYINNEIYNPYSTVINQTTDNHITKINENGTINSINDGNFLYLEDNGKTLLGIGHHYDDVNNVSYLGFVTPDGRSGSPLYIKHETAGDNTTIIKELFQVYAYGDKLVFDVDSAGAIKIGECSVGVGAKCINIASDNSCIETFGNATYSLDFGNGKFLEFDGETHVGVGGGSSINLLSVLKHKLTTSGSELLYADTSYFTINNATGDQIVNITRSSRRISIYTYTSSIPTIEFDSDNFKFWSSSTISTHTLLDIDRVNNHVILGNDNTGLGLYINGIVATTSTAKVLYYNTSTGEVTAGDTSSSGGLSWIGTGDSVGSVALRDDSGNLVYNTMLQIDATGLKFTNGSSINEFSIDGTLSDNSDNVVPTEKAIKTYVDSSKQLTDADGNSYDTITINGKQWTIQNFRCTKYNDGTPIPEITDATTWENDTSGAYCYYDNDSSDAEKYGALYNWYAVNNSKFAPQGWRVPTDEEWTELENYMIAKGYNWDGTTAVDKIGKSLASQTDWASSDTEGHVGNNPSTNNSSGFSALPGGRRDHLGTFRAFGEFIHFWSATESNTSDAYDRYLAYVIESIDSSSRDKKQGISVRLVRDVGDTLWGIDGTTLGVTNYNNTIDSINLHGLISMPNLSNDISNVGKILIHTDAGEVVSNNKINFTSGVFSCTNITDTGVNNTSIGPDSLVGKDATTNGNINIGSSAGDMTGVTYAYDAETYDSNNINIGRLAGSAFNGMHSMFLGSTAGLNSSGKSLLGIGGYSLNGANGELIHAFGVNAGRNSTGSNCVYLGLSAGLDNAIDNVFEISWDGIDLITGDTSTGIVRMPNLATETYNNVNNIIGYKTDGELVNTQLIEMYPDDSIEKVGESEAGGNDPRKILFKDNYMFVLSATDHCIYIYDVSNKQSPKYMFPSPQIVSIQDIIIEDDILYTFDASNGYSLKTFDISDINNITLLDQINVNMGNGGMQFVKEGNFIYCAAHSNNYLTIFNVSDPNNMLYVGDETLTEIRSLAVKNNYLFIGSRSGIIWTYDISDPYNVTHINNITPAISGSDDFLMFKIKDNYLYVLNNTEGIDIFDISDPALVTYVTSVITDMPRGYDIANNILYISDYLSKELFLYDISNPLVPSHLKTINVGTSIFDIKISGNYLYLSVNNNLIYVYKISGIDVSSASIGNIDSQEIRTEHLQSDFGAFGHVSASSYNILHSKSISVESPSVGDNITLFYTSKSINMHKLAAVINNGSATITYTIKYSSDRSTAGTEVVVNGTAVTSGSTGEFTLPNNLSNPVISPGSWIWLEVTAVSGTPELLNVTMEYTQGAK